MSASSLNVLSFIGGPFDGFDEQLAGFDELPRCVALPMSSVASEIFGMPIRRSASSIVAIYELERRERVAYYRFRGMRQAEKRSHGTHGTNSPSLTAQARESTHAPIGDRLDTDKHERYTCKHDRFPN